MSAVGGGQLNFRWNKDVPTARSVQLFCFFVSLKCTTLLSACIFLGASGMIKGLSKRRCVA